MQSVNVVFVELQETLTPEIVPAVAVVDVDAEVVAGATVQVVPTEKVAGRFITVVAPNT